MKITFSKMKHQKLQQRKRSKIIYKKQLIALILTFSLAIAIIPVSSFIYADTEMSQRRYESVYVNLDSFGQVKGATMYVDTMLNGTKEIIDHGKFSSVENMSNKISPIYDDSGNLIWDLTADNDESFAYNVVLDESTYKNVPWNFNLSYELNGKEINPNKVAHSNGLVKITVDITPNEEADSYYRNNYMLEITADFDMNDYISVTSPDAIEMMTGKTKTLMWVVLPGASNTFELMLGSEDFTYDGLTFAIMPVSGEISEKIVELIEDKKELEDAYNASMSSTDIVLNALGNMTTGLNEAASGLTTIKTGTIKMHALKGSRDLTVDELEAELGSLTSHLDEMQKHLENSRTKMTEFYDMLEDMNKQTNNLEVSLENLTDDFDDLEDMAENLGRDANDAKMLVSYLQDAVDTSRDLIDLLSDASKVDSAAIKTNANKVASNVSAAGEIAGALLYSDASNPDYQELAASLSAAGSSLNALAADLTSLSALSSSEISVLDDLDTDLKNISKYMGYIVSDLDDLEEDAPVFESTIADANSMLEDLTEAIKVINDYSDKFMAYEGDVDGALENLSNIADTLNDTTTTLTNAMPTIKETLSILSNELYSGAVSSLNGLTEITKQMANATSQTATFIDAKDKVDNVIRKNWDDIDEKSTIFEMDPNAKKVSFSSSENIEPEKIQIFLKTPEIKEVIDEDLVKFTSETGKVGIWARIWSLFVKMWEAITGIFS